MTHSPLARRSATTLVTLGLAAGALVAGTGASQADDVADITGVVTTAAGAPLAGIDVYAYSIGPNGTGRSIVDSTMTGTDGRYILDDLDPAALAGDPTTAGLTQFKVEFEDNKIPSPANGLRPVRYLDAFYGGFDSIVPSPVVTVPAGGAATANQALATAAGLAVTIVGPAGTPVYAGNATVINGAVKNFGPGTFESGFGSTFSDDGFYPDDPNTPESDAPRDGVALVSQLKPGQSYKVLGSGYDNNVATGQETDYVAQFFGGGTSLSKAAVVTPAAGVYTPLTIALKANLTADVAPRIIGNASFGSTLTADPGSFADLGNASFVYQWLRGSTVVATGPTYAVTKADKKAKIKLVVTAYQGDLFGQASSEPTAKVGEKSTVKAKKNKSGGFNVTVKVSKKVAKKAGTPSGKVVLLNEDGTKASKAVKIKNGSATLSTNSKADGTPLTVAYLGGKKIGSDYSPVKGGGKKKK